MTGAVFYVIMFLIFRKVLLVFFFIGFIFGETSSKGEAYEYFLKAEYVLLQNDFNMAEQYYEKALSLCPDSPTILHSLSDLKIYQGEYSDAIKYLERILLLDPYDKEIGLDLYDIYNRYL